MITRSIYAFMGDMLSSYLHLFIISSASLNTLLLQSPDDGQGDMCNYI